MNIFLAVNERSLEKYIATLKDCNVIRTRKDNKKLVDDVIEHNPHILIMSNALLQKENNSLIISELRAKQPHTRIIYLYGADDCYRKTFTNFLIEQGIYDWHIGTINEEIITDLIRYPKSIADVSLEDVSKEDMEAIKKREEERKVHLKEFQEELRNKLNEEKLTEEEIEETIEKEVEEKILVKEVKRLEVRIIERVEEIEKEKIVEKEVFKTKLLDQTTIAIMSLTSQSNKDFMVSNLASLLSEEHKVLVIDFETPFPSMDLHFDVDKHIYLEDYYTNKRLTGIMGCISAYKRNVLNKNTFSNFVKNTKDKNIDILTGLYDIETFDSTELEEVQEIINVAKSNYEVVLISLNQFIANSFTYVGLELADKVLLVSEDTYSNARSNISFIKEMVENQKEAVEKFNIVLYGDTYIDDTVNYRLYEGYNFIGRVEADVKGNYNSLNQKKICVRENINERVKYNSLISALGFAEIREKGFKALIKKIKEVVS